MSDSEFDVVAALPEDKVNMERVIDNFSKALQLEFNSTENKDFEIINTMRWDPALDESTLDDQMNGRSAEPWYFEDLSDAEKDAFNAKCSPIWLFHNHMERLKVSVAFFGWDVEVEPETILDNILKAIEGSSVEVDGKKCPAKEHPLKIRALLGPSGNMTIETSKVGPKPLLMEFDKVANGKPTYDVYVAKEPISVGPFTCFKTTKREQYNAARAEYITKPMTEEVLFVNDNGHVTEGSITNIAVQVNEMWTTPKVTSGCLMGVTRRHLIDTTKIFEGFLTCEDLQEGQEVLIFNAVQGVSKGVVKLK
ncbi:Aminodeoxychorismate lyase [Yarrowia sp. C11]|nr:Aminodeoxychorismate lyase [Yarrowia sp. E02]KAG5367424.1 Aminodeoxychorismate lyase [Yarrowia sp. C11]